MQDLYREIYKIQKESFKKVPPHGETESGRRKVCRVKTPISPKSFSPEESRLFLFSVPWWNLAR